MLIEKGTDKAVYTLRVQVDDARGNLGKVFMTIDEAGAGVGDITRAGSGLNHTTRDIDVLVNDQEHLNRILEGLGTWCMAVSRTPPGARLEDPGIMTEEGISGRPCRTRTG